MDDKKEKEHDDEEEDVECISMCCSEGEDRKSVV